MPIRAVCSIKTQPLRRGRKSPSNNRIGPVVVFGQCLLSVRQTSLIVRPRDGKPPVRNAALPDGHKCPLPGKLVS